MEMLPPSLLMLQNLGALPEALMSAEVAAIRGAGANKARIKSGFGAFMEVFEMDFLFLLPPSTCF